jgi:hypothetical protein
VVAFPQKEGGKTTFGIWISSKNVDTLGATCCLLLQITVVACRASRLTRMAPYFFDDFIWHARPNFAEENGSFWKGEIEVE